MEDLKTYFIYTNTNNEIFQIKETSLPFSKNADKPMTLDKMTLIHKIQEMKRDELGFYILKHIVLHHAVINSDNIHQYISRDLPENNPFLREMSYLSDICLKPTDHIFYPLTALYIILKQPLANHNQSTTKKVMFSTDRPKLKKRKSLKKKY